MRTTLRAAVALLTASLLVLPTTGATAAKPAPPDRAAQTGKPLTVMTRNIYLGGNIMAPIAAVQGKSGAEALLALGHANHQLRQVVDRTDFPTRARLLAREIATTQPDLVGLQEVALWRSGPMELGGALGVRNATQVDFDFLAILLDEIEATGASYRVVAEQREADVEAPAFPEAPNPADPRASDQRLTMRDVVLMRADKGLRVTASGNGNYTRNFAVNLLGLPLTFLRGYNWVDVQDGPNQVRFVNTHLESASSDVALAQARELLAGPAAHDGDTVVVCDCNSDPLDHSVKPIDAEGTPHSGPYDFIVGQGLVDQWLTHAPAEQGWTAGLSETVDDATANDPGGVGLDHRIDMVFARGDGGAISADKGQITGDEVTDKDPATGLWPSDHAGVVLRLRGLS